MLLLASALLFTASAAPLAPAPTVPAGWSYFPHHCMSGSGCTSGHCNCGQEILAPGCNKLGECSCKTAATCVATALAKCKTVPTCKSFAINGLHYELYTLTVRSHAHCGAAGPLPTNSPPPHFNGI